MISRNAQRQLAATRSRASSSTLKRVENRAKQVAVPATQAYAAMQAFRGMKLPGPRRAAGLSLVELLIALAITALLMTAVMVATDASFKAYAAAAESASAQSATRMVTNRLLTLVRTSTAHGPLEPDPSTTPAIAFKDGSDDTLDSHYLELVDQTGQYVKIEYAPGATEGEAGKLTITTEINGTESTVDLLGGVIDAHFYTHRRVDSEGVLVLDRATMDISVAPDVDNTLAIEDDTREPIRVIASTMPRKLE